MVRTPLIAGAVALLLLTAPAAAQDVGIQNPDSATPTTLYFHLRAQQDFAINTQLPDDRYDTATSRGLTAPTTSCVPDGPLGQVDQSFHTLYGFSTPGYVEYEYQENGGPRIHPERGLATDVHLASGEGAVGYWYLKTQFTGGDNRIPGTIAADDLPSVTPQVKVRMTVRTGDEVSIGASAYNEGEIIAQGESEALVLAPVESEHYFPQEDGSHVYEFRVPLEIQRDTILADEAYNIRVDTFMEVPGCDEDPDSALMSSNVQVHTSPDLRPRLDWSITNPIAIEYIHPQFAGKDLFIHTGFNSPWGNYDVDERPGGVEVVISGPSEARNLVRAAVVQRTHEHGHHFEPVDMTYVWPFHLDEADNGAYTVTVTARNDQGTAEAIGVALFEIGPNTAVDSDGNPVVGQGDGSEQEAPGAGIIAVLGILAVAFVLRRRTP